jgi:hypothetical protein
MRPTPSSIKSQIYRKYLEGYSISEISKLFKTSVGNISSIAKEVSSKDEYYIVIREVTKMLRSNNLELSDVISGIRLKNQIQGAGLTITFFENFLESTNTESFTLGIDHEKFLELVKRIFHFEKTFKIKLEGIPDIQNNALKELTRFTEKISRIRQQYSQLYAKYSVKKAEVEDYLKEKPFLISQSKFVNAVLPTHLDWMVFSDESLEKASRKIGIKIDRKTFYKKLNSIYKEPDKHTDIVKQIMNS